MPYFHGNCGLLMAFKNANGAVGAILSTYCLDPGFPVFIHIIDNFPGKIINFINPNSPEVILSGLHPPYESLTNLLENA